MLAFHHSLVSIPDIIQWGPFSFLIKLIIVSQTLKILMHIYALIYCKYTQHKFGSFCRQLFLYGKWNHYNLSNWTVLNLYNDCLCILKQLIQRRHYKDIRMSLYYQSKHSFFLMMINNNKKKPQLIITKVVKLLHNLKTEIQQELKKNSISFPVFMKKSLNLSDDCY